jgi:uncharacterized protein YdhG (YjbR/CyaY superfamily)
MKKDDPEFKTVDRYIASFPDNAGRKLAELRSTVRELAPEAQEKISYRMPAYFLGRNLLYFAGFAKHIGFYPGAEAIACFEPELAKYKHAKGSVQFPLDRPLPLTLIRRLVKFRLASLSRAPGKKPAKKKKAERTVG